MAEREMSLKELQEENLRIQNEHLRQQTEYYRRENAQHDARHSERVRQHKTQEETLELGRAQARGREGGCTHLKGGKGDDLVANQGDGQKGGYSVLKHLHSWGEWQVLCSRCWASWWPGDTETNHPTGIGFEKAIKFPTDNASSASAQFRLDPAIVAGLRAERLAQRGFEPDGKTRRREVAATAA